MNIPYYLSEINQMLTDSFRISYKKHKNTYDLYIIFNNELIEYLMYDASKKEVYKSLKAIYTLISWGKGLIKWKELKLH